jgi:hypothetical protein
MVNSRPTINDGLNDRTIPGFLDCGDGRPGFVSGPGTLRLTLSGCGSKSDVAGECASCLCESASCRAIVQANDAVGDDVTGASVRETASGSGSGSGSESLAIGSRTASGSWTVSGRGRPLNATGSESWSSTASGSESDGDDGAAATGTQTKAMWSKTCIYSFWQPIQLGPQTNYLNFFRSKRQQQKPTRLVLLRDEWRLLEWCDCNSALNTTSFVTKSDSDSSTNILVQKYSVYFRWPKKTGPLKASTFLEAPRSFSTAAETTGRNCRMMSKFWV